MTNAAALSRKKSKTQEHNFSEASMILVQAALAEDAGGGDATSELVIPRGARGSAVIYSREKGIFCGGPVLEAVFRFSDPGLKIELLCPEGASFKPNAPVARIKGSVRSILKGERTALNFLARLSAIATQTRAYVDAVRKHQVLILDTRKTTPLWRELEKYAVKTGGGKNHRMGLYDAIFIKENHRPYGDLSKLKSVKAAVEIEVRSQAELREALKLQPRVILFDNFTPARLSEAVRLARKISPEAILEASGGITLENVAHYAAMGVDWISVGALTHSVRSLNFSLLLK